MSWIGVCGVLHNVLLNDSCNFEYWSDSSDGEPDDENEEAVIDDDGDPYPARRRLKLQAIAAGRRPADTN